MKQYVVIVAIFICLCSIFAVTTPARFPKMKISDGEVVLGTWNSNVGMVIEKAKELHRPALIVHAQRGCPHCYRLMAAMTNDMFVAWQKERKILMGIYHRNRPSIRIGSANKSNAKSKPSLMKEMSSSGVTAPVVCVYWPKEDGMEIKRIFSGTRGNMLGQKHEKLEGELIKAVDSIIQPDGKGFLSTKQQKKEVTK